ncbi:MAG: pyruvate kinase [archaeon]
MVDAIVTVPPYAPFLKKVARHGLVSGLRLNTVMPIKKTETLEEVIKRLQDIADGKDVWIDLKGRQLRVVSYWAPPFTSIELSHPITVNVPTTAYFSNGTDQATVVAIDGNKLITLEGPRRVVGPGESVNIIDSSLVIEGNLTDTDKAYIAAARNVKNSKYMMSFVESNADLDDVKALDPAAELIAKIESRKGLQYVQKEAKGVRLMTARGDLYQEVPLPHDIIAASESIIKKDKRAIMASRLFASLSNSNYPSCEDIGDVDNVLRMGYRTLMLGDDVCMREESVLSALNLLEAIAERYS